MVKLSLAVTALLLSLTPFACSAAIQKPGIKLNPNPRMRYELTVRIEDAPGPFDAIDGALDYRVSNADCVPLTLVAGATILPSKRVPLTLTPAGNDTYRGEFFIDLFQDEDYFGKGVCHWSVVAADVDAHVKKMDFSASLPKDDIFSHNATTQYYSHRAYTESDTELVNTGHRSRAEFKDPVHTFSISETAEDKVP